MILIIFQTFVYYKFDYIFFYQNLAHLKKAQYVSHHVSFDPPYNTAQQILFIGDISGSLKYSSIWN